MPLNFTKPVTTDNYQTGVLPSIIDAHKALAQMLDAAKVGALTGIPDGAKRYNAGSLEEWNGTSWVLYDSVANRARYMDWKNGGAGYVIIDASAGTSPTGSVISKADAATQWAANSPTLVGWNGTTTFGVRVDSSRNADTTTQRTFSNVKTDGVNRGSYGTVSVAGVFNGYAGIDFTAITGTLMGDTTGQFGYFFNNNTWKWRFDANGSLVAGTVPWASVSSKPTALSQFSNDTGFITTAGRAYPRRSDGASFDIYWSGQSGQPTWLLGSNDGANFYVWNPSNFSVSFAALADTAIRLTTTAGDAPGYAARAWINFNGITPAIRSHGNVSSITRLQSGVFQINFTQAMQDTNYAVSVTGSHTPSMASSYIGHEGHVSYAFATYRTAGSILVAFNDSSIFYNPESANVVVYR